MVKDNVNSHCFLSTCGYIILYYNKYIYKKLILKKRTLSSEPALYPPK